MFVPSPFPLCYFGIYEAVPFVTSLSRVYDELSSSQVGRHFMVYDGTACHAVLDTLLGAFMTRSAHLT